MSALDLAQLIRERAYQRWQARGETHGAADDDWLEAEREVQELDAQVQHGLEEQASPVEAWASLPDDGDEASPAPPPF